jgi:hypothetical protein
MEIVNQASLFVAVDLVDGQEQWLATAKQQSRQVKVR